MTDQFLSQQDLRQLTGYKRPSLQAKQLIRQGVPFFLNGRGYPQVHRTAVETVARPQTHPQTPNYQALERRS